MCKGSLSELPSTSVGDSRRQVESTGKGKSQAERVGGLIGKLGARSPEGLRAIATLGN